MFRAQNFIEYLFDGVRVLQILVQHGWICEPCCWIDAHLVRGVGARSILCLGIEKTSSFRLVNFDCFSGFKVIFEIAFERSVNKFLWSYSCAN